MLGLGLPEQAMHVDGFSHSRLVVENKPIESSCVTGPSALIKILQICFQLQC